MDYSLPETLILRETLKRQRELEAAVGEFPADSWQATEVAYMLTHGIEYRFSDWFSGSDSERFRKQCQRAAMKLEGLGLLVVGSRMSSLQLTNAGRSVAEGLFPAAPTTPEVSPAIVPQVAPLLTPVVVDLPELRELPEVIAGDVSQSIDQTPPAAAPPTDSNEALSIEQQFSETVVTDDYVPDEAIDDDFPEDASQAAE